MAWTSRHARWIGLSRKMPSAARLEQAIDSPQAPVDRLRRVPAITGALGQRDLVSGRDQAHHLGEVRENPVARSVHLGGGVGQPEMNEGILVDSRVVAHV